MLEYGRKKLYVSRFPQLLFDMISPLGKNFFGDSKMYFYEKIKKFFQNSQNLIQINFF
jgi:hypothetical protein